MQEMGRDTVSGRRGSVRRMFEATTLLRADATGKRQILLHVFAQGTVEKLGRKI